MPTGKMADLARYPTFLNTDKSTRGGDARVVTVVQLKLGPASRDIVLEGTFPDAQILHRSGIRIQDIECSSI